MKVVESKENAASKHLSKLPLAKAKEWYDHYKNSYEHLCMLLGTINDMLESSGLVELGENVTPADRYHYAKLLVEKDEVTAKCKVQRDMMETYDIRVQEARARFEEDSTAANRDFDTVMEKAKFIIQSDPKKSSGLSLILRGYEENKPLYADDPELEQEFKNEFFKAVKAQIEFIKQK